MMIKAVVLDIGGVLLRTEDRTSRQSLEQKYHIEGGVEHLVFGSPQAQASSLGLASTDSIWESVSQSLSLSPEDLKDFIEAFWAGDSLDTAATTYLQELRPAYTTGLLTNAWMDARKTLANEYGLVVGDTVDYLLISSELGLAKPDHRIYEVLRNTIGHNYHEILFVDDFIENIEAANSLGIQTIHYQSGMNLINQIKSRLE
jgi:putative hydrolase of the HAD superfamily